MTREQMEKWYHENKGRIYNKYNRNKRMTDEQRKQYRKEYKQQWYQDNKQKVLDKKKSQWERWKK